MRPSKSYSVIKRIIDVFLSFVAIILLSWLFVIIAIINLFCARGKPFYLDPRVGLNGKKIGVLKFTSMRNDAEENPEKYLNAPAIVLLSLLFFDLILTLQLIPLCKITRISTLSLYGNGYL